MVYRKLNRDTKHRKALLRNMVSSLIEYESITTTHAKAKEVQTAAERLITLAKKRSPTLEAAKIRADQYLFKPKLIIPKLFGEIADRYKNRSGGYTRVLRLENRIGDNAPQSILELVGGKRDMKMALTARAVARHGTSGTPLTATIQHSINKITGNDPELKKRFEQEVQFMKEKFYGDKEMVSPPVESPVLPRRAKVRFVVNPLASRVE